MSKTFQSMTEKKQLTTKVFVRNKHYVCAKCTLKKILILCWCFFLLVFAFLFK